MSTTSSASVRVGGSADLQLGPGLVQRPRLETRLDRTPPGGVAVVVAFAGSGKSVLLGQWAATLPHDGVTVLTLTGRHDDAVLFGAALAGALRTAVPTIDPALESLVAAGGDRLGEVFVERVLDELDHLDRELVVVVDDLHALTNQGLLADLETIVLRLPPTVRMVLAARWDPPMRLRRLWMDGRMVEIRADELAFAEGEGAALVESVSGRSLPRHQLVSLVDHTDGWAAGLHLAAVSLRGADDPAAFVDEFTGTNRLVVEYLTEEVLDRQPDSTRRFLLETSILPWLSPELCDATTGRDDAVPQLAALQQRSLFVVPSGLDGGRFRYHHLFSELLRYRLVTELGADAESQLRRNAATWLRSHGHVADAVTQLLDAGDPAAAFVLTTEVAQELHARGRSGTLVRWLEQVRSQLPECPAEIEVNLLAAQVAAFQSVEASDTYRRLDRRGDLTDGERAAAAALAASLGLDQWSPESTAKMAGTALDLLKWVEPSEVTDFLGIGGFDSVAAIAEFMTAVSEFCQGDVVRSAARLERVIGLPGTRFPIWKVQALGWAGLVNAWNGSLNDADRFATSALAVAAAADVVEHPSTVGAHLALTLVAQERHAPTGEVARRLRETEVRNERQRRARMRDLERLLAVRLAAEAEDASRALELLATPAASQVPPRLLAAAQCDLEVRLLLRCGKVAQARSVVQRTGHEVSHAAAIDVALADGDAAAARRRLDRWTPEPACLTEVVEHGIRTGAVLHAEGNESAATCVWMDAVAAAEREELRRPFLEGPVPLRLLLASASRGAAEFLRSLVDAAANADLRHAGQAQLVEPLTERELAVLELLPTRLSNRDIAVAIYVSVNTVKTHLRNIYRKLEVADRDAAVERAVALGLL